MLNKHKGINMDFDFEDCGIETISKARLEELTVKTSIVTHDT